MITPFACGYKSLMAVNGTEASHFSDLKHSHDPENKIYYQNQRIEQSIQEQIQSNCFPIDLIQVIS
jgi:hypothetical protein